ncbi:hypothetical protein C8054_07000 [Micromonospora sp. RP3T]|nr:hypothetical protein C8054_07000 [Micromonospora sp. RP3T]
MGEAERRRRRLRHHGEAIEPSAAGELSATTAAVDDDVTPRPPRGVTRAEPESSDDGSRAPRGARRAEPESSDDGSRAPRGARRAEPESSDDGSRAPRGARRAELESSEPRGRRGAPSADDGERGLRGLVGSGSSQVSVTAALRARDAARPSEDDLAAAEARVVLVRRNWVPREDLPRGGR